MRAAVSVIGSTDARVSTSQRETGSTWPLGGGRRRLGRRGVRRSPRVGPGPCCPARHAREGGRQQQRLGKGAPVAVDAANRVREPARGAPRPAAAPAPCPVVPVGTRLTQ